jgi:hypothetical protein
MRNRHDLPTTQPHLECGGKRSATPLSVRPTYPKNFREASRPGYILHSAFKNLHFWGLSLQKIFS